jgi:tetratricopeptide (TPR) repeat protein
MSEIHVSSLTPRQQTVYAKARYAFESGNLEYVFQACAELLHDAPACLSVRQLQRMAQLRRHETGNQLLARVRGSISTAGFLLRLDRSDAAEAFAAAERILDQNPTSAPGLRLLGKAASALGMLDTAIFAFEELCESDPRDRCASLLLASACLAAGRSAAALRVANRVLKEHPTDSGALKIAREASVAETMSRGNWAAALAGQPVEGTARLS